MVLYQSVDGADRLGAASQPAENSAYKSTHAQLVSLEKD